MKRTQKTAALGVALCLATSLLASCGNGTNTAEYYELVKASCDSALTIESGEILVYESITADVDMDNGYKNGSIETYIRFEGTDAPDFELSAAKVNTTTGESSTYELIKDGDMVLELENGIGDVVTDTKLPDIFENFRVNFSAEDIKKVDIEQREKGIKSYKLTMKPAFADTVDSEADGVSTDCTALAYSFYIDSLDRLSKIVCEMTLTVTVDGQIQTVTRVIDSEIA